MCSISNTTRVYLGQQGIKSIYKGDGPVYERPGGALYIMLTSR